MVVSVGHFDSDQEKFVVDGKLHNGTALPGSTDAWRQSVTHLQDNIDTVGREFHRLENMPHLNCRVIDRPATHPRDEYSLMMKMKTPYRMASILPPASEYKALQTIATNADTIDLPSKEVCESNPSSIRRYSGPSDGQPLSFVIVYETGHVAIHARENCMYEGQFVFAVEPKMVTELFDCVYESGFGRLKHTYLGSKDSLTATSLGLCVGDDQQWVYAYTNSPPNAFDTLEKAVIEGSGVQLFETGEQKAITSTLTSDHVAPVLALLANNSELLQEIQSDAILAGIRTGLQSNQEMTNYAALEVLSEIDCPIPDSIWAAACSVHGKHPDLIRKITEVSMESSELTQHVATMLLETLSTGDRRHRDAALESFSTLGEHDPSVLIEALPTFETILKDGANSEQQATLDAILLLAKTEPEYVAPLSATLLEFIEQQSHPIRSSAIIGHLSKALPYLATTAIETFGEWIEADETRIRNNGLAVLADLTSTYPERVLPYANRVHELLWDEDEYVRYNATSVLAGLAQTDPAVVKPVIDRLCELLTADRTETQQNACWALGRLGAQNTLPELRTLRHTASEESVCAAATAAEILITTTECPRCKSTFESHEISVSIDINSPLYGRLTCSQCNQTSVIELD